MTCPPIDIGFIEWLVRGGDEGSLSREVLTYSPPGRTHFKTHMSRVSQVDTVSGPERGDSAKLKTGRILFLFLFLFLFSFSFSSNNK